MRPRPNTSAAKPDPIQVSHERTVIRRRRARANASTAATSTGRIRVSDSSEITQPGTTWLTAVT